VVDEPVDHGGGDNLIAEHFAPAAEGLVAGDDQSRDREPPAAAEIDPDVPRPVLSRSIDGCGVVDGDQAVGADSLDQHASLKLATRSSAVHDGWCRVTYGFLDSVSGLGRHTKLLPNRFTG
jgi:hypothetical protein